MRKGMKTTTRRSRVDMIEALVANRISRFPALAENRADTVWFVRHHYRTRRDLECACANFGV